MVQSGHAIGARQMATAPRINPFLRGGIMRYRRLACWATVVFGLSAVQTGVADAQTESATEAAVKPSEAKKTSPVDPTGTWIWQYTISDNDVDFQVKLNWDGKKLTGTYTAFDETTDIEESKLEKDQLTFVTKREFNGTEIVATFSGKVKPDDIEGTVSVEIGDDDPREFDWNAKRSVEIDDVLGTWELKVETPNGVIEPRLTLTKDGDKLQGKYVSPFGERDPKNLSLKDNELSWEISGERDGIEFKVVYTGKPRGNSIDGTSEFDFAGNTGTIEFTGTRTPPDEEKEKPAKEAKPAGEGASAADATDGEPAAQANSADN
jgi:hypothetical protein